MSYLGTKRPGNPHLQHNCGRGEINPSNSSQFIAINSNGDVETISWSTIEYVQFTDGLYSFTGSEIGHALAAASDRLASLVIGDFRGVTLAAAMNSASLSELGEGNVRENRFTHKALKGPIDLGEAHAIDGAVVDVIAEPDASRGTLVAGVDADGRLAWTYTVADAELNSIRAGQTIVQHYALTVQVADGHTIERTVSVSLVGGADFAGRVLVGDEREDVLIGSNGDDGSLAATGMTSSTRHGDRRPARRGGRRRAGGGPR